MRPILFAFLFIFIYPVSRAGAQVESTFGSSLSDSKKKLIEQNFQNLPASFRKNMGQWDDNILFESGSSGIHIYFMKDGISYTS
ncbi:MAG: hypothetical protein JNL63_01320, partial [Bacteroidia bacterium]|nr:hypothetical protein [Bacteroidia bacterium]